MTTALPARPLGRTGIDVSALGFGCAPLGELYARIDETVAQAALRAAFDAGITLFDVAPLYGHGLAEHRLGAALRAFGRDGVVVSTKVGRVMDPRAPRDGGSGYAGGLPHRAAFDYSYDGTLRAIDQSLLRLATDRIDIALIHDVDVHTHGREGVDARFAEAMEGAYRALVELRRAGAVRAIGVGVNEAEIAARFARAGEFDCVLLAGRYTLLEQGALDDFLPLAAQRGMGVMLGGVFNSGILASGAVAGAKYDYRDAPPEVIARVRRIAGVCAAHGVALPVAAVRFALAHPAVSTLVLGAVTPDEVLRNVRALAQPVPAALWPDLVAAGLVRGDAPLPA
ncbi:MAG TPA: aldo/keto reductase [Casimicrobiaceae bacterium]|jgi:D-threo-aldose 1-dehydrogenase|nr:aldo/keto reductase [Casimicrobiaceae bacterium]